MLALAALSLGAAISLILLTTYLHRTTIQLETGLQGVRLAEEMQIDLLTYIRKADPIIRKTMERDLIKKLHQARQYAVTPEEQSLLQNAEDVIQERFSDESAEAGLEGTPFENAFESLRRFIDIKVEESEASMRASERWDDLGDRIGVGFSVVFVAGVAAILLWLRRAAFQPVFEIQDAIRNFASGRKDTRAPEHGPEELRTIARQFNEMAVSLARQYENQASFLAAVAHDLRNPIGLLRSSAEILSSGRDLSSETTSSLMSIIKRQVDGLDRMIGDLLDRSRIEAGRLELRIREYDARSIARNAFDLFSSASSTHRLVLSVPDAPAPLHCDPLRIEQVLNNLLSNAVKYSPHGTRIELSVEPDGADVQFRVSDEGAGISPEDLQYIFEPFRRTGAVKDEVPGVGLGLSVAQRIVRAHGGRIEVESRIGKGTTFRVRLPVARAGVAA